MATQGKLIITYEDYTNEKSTVTVPTDSQDAASLAAFETACDTLKAAFEALMIAPSVFAETRVYSAEVPNEGGSSNPLNQRETKLLISGKTETTGKIRRLEMPGFDLTELSAVNRGEVDITAGVGLALLTALEVVWFDATLNEAIEVTEMRHVGRNT